MELLPRPPAPPPLLLTCNPPSLFSLMLSLLPSPPSVPLPAHLAFRRQYKACLHSCFVYLLACFPGVLLLFDICLCNTTFIFFGFATILLLLLVNSFCAALFSRFCFQYCTLLQLLLIFAALSNIPNSDKISREKCENCSCNRVWQSEGIYPPNPPCAFHLHCYEIYNLELLFRKLSN